jgi:hypothetical protein
VLIAWTPGSAERAFRAELLVPGLVAVDLAQPGDR